MSVVEVLRISATAESTSDYLDVWKEADPYEATP